VGLPGVRELRCPGNLSEVLLCQEIKNDRFLGLDFDRQKIIGNYIVDFYCAEKQVVVEIDGSSHENKLITMQIGMPSWPGLA